MSEKEKPSKARKGCVNRIAVLFLLLMIGGMGAALFMISQAQDLSDIEGYGAKADGKESRNLERVLANALKGGYELTLTEEDLNLYLRDTLKLEQAGFLAEHVELKDVLIRLEEDLAELIMVREIAGYAVTHSMYLRVEQSEMPDGSILKEVVRNRGPYHESVPRPGVGGRFGKLPIPEGFLLLVMPAYGKLAAAYRDVDADEPVHALDFIEEMARISFKQGKLVLDPRPNTRDMIGPGGF